MNETQAIIQIAFAGGIVGAMGGYIAGSLRQFRKDDKIIQRLKAQIRALTPKKKRVPKPRRTPYDYKDDLDSTQRFPVVDADGC